MSVLDIDFAATARRGSNLAGLLLLLAGAAILTLLVLELDDLEEQTVAAEARLRSLSRRASLVAGSKSADVAADPATVAANEALGRLRTPWPELLEQLEALSDLPVAVLDVQADARGRTLRLGAEAKTMDDVLAFVDRLRRSPRIDEAWLLGQEPRKASGSEVIAFTVMATWPDKRGGVQ